MTTTVTQTVVEVLYTGTGTTQATQTVVEVLRTAAINTTPPIKITQGVELVLGTVNSVNRTTQGVFQILGVTKPNIQITQSAFLVLTRPGHKISFAQFKEPTFHDWVQSGDNVNYESYMITWYDIPAAIDWSQTPYSYYFLKNGTINDNSLKVQYRWDYARKNA